MNCRQAGAKDTNELPVDFKSMFEEMDEIAKQERILAVIICSDTHQILSNSPLGQILFPNGLKSTERPLPKRSFPQ